MLPLLLLAGLALRPVDLGEPVLAVRVVDVDADGAEDVVAVSREHLFLLPRGRAPAVKRPAPRLTVVGHGLLGVVRDGRFHRVDDPFGEWKEGEAGAPSLLAALGRGTPALLDAPGDLDGDGRADAVLCGPQGFTTPAGVVPVVPEAKLDVYRNEAFAVEYRIPVPVVGSWTGEGPELVLFAGGAVVAHRDAREVERVPLPLAETAKEAEAMRRNEVRVRDVDGDGRLDLLVVVAKGRTELFAKFEATVRHFRGGRVYDQERKLFHRPASFLKVAGLLLRSQLVDADGDGDLDLVLSTVDTSLLSTATGVATGSAPGTYHVFRLEDGSYQRRPAWTLESPVPLAAFTDRPEPPAHFLPDLDRDGRPEVLVVGPEVRLLAAGAEGAFAEVAKREAGGAGRPSVGRTLAAVPCETGVLVAEASR